MGDKTTVKMDKELVKQAHELGLNVSKVCENALKETISRLKGSNQGCDRSKVMKTKTVDKSQVSAYHSSSNLGNPNSSSFSRLGLPSVSQPRIS